MVGYLCVCVGFKRILGSMIILDTLSYWNDNNQYILKHYCDSVFQYGNPSVVYPLIPHMIMLGNM